MRLGIMSRHKSASDGHWGSLVGALSLLCMVNLIHRLVLYSQSCPGESQRILASLRPWNKEPTNIATIITGDSITTHIETWFCLILLLES